MVYTGEVYQWFKELAAHSRIEFTCNLLKLCVPSELRFISTLLEDMNSKDYPSLRDTEERCNSPSEFSQYTHVQLNSEHVHKLCLSLSLLKPTNQTMAQMIYEILRIHFHYVCNCVMLHSDIKADIMLLYALASYHPAFTFNCRHKLAEYFTSLLEIYNDSTDISTNCNNSALKETIEHCELTISVCDVIMEKSDALIVVEMVSQKVQQKNVTKKQCKYSQIRDTVTAIFPIGHQFHRKIVTLSSNGSFTSNNVRDIVTKIIRFADSEFNREEAKEIIDFFNKLPIWNYIQKPSKCFHTDNIEEDCTEINSDCIVPEVFPKTTPETDSNSPADLTKQTMLSCIGPCVIKDKPGNISRSLSLQSEPCSIVHSSDITSMHQTNQSTTTDPESCDPGYSNQNLYPLNMLTLPYNPLIRYYLPNYKFYVQSKCSTSTSTSVLSTSSSSNNSHDMLSSSLTVSDGAQNADVTKITPQYHHDSLINNQCLPGTTFIPYNLHQTSFTPVQLLCHPISPCFHSSEPYTSILSHVTPSYTLSNVVIRPQTTTMHHTQHHIRQKSTQHNPDFAANIE